MTLTVYVGLNVEYSGPRGVVGFSYPLLSLTGLIGRYYGLRRRCQHLAQAVSLAVNVAVIGGKAVAWGVM